jgi:hypothetical protein
MGNQPAAGSCSTLGFKRLHRNASFPPQEMNTIGQAMRVLDRAFTATIAKNSGTYGASFRMTGARQSR